MRSFCAIAFILCSCIHTVQSRSFCACGWVFLPPPSKSQHRCKVRSFHLGYTPHLHGLLYPIRHPPQPTGHLLHPTRHRLHPIRQFPHPILQLLHPIRHLPHPVRHLLKKKFHLNVYKQSHTFWTHVLKNLHNCICTG